MVSGPRAGPLSGLAFSQLHSAGLVRFPSQTEPNQAHTNPTDRTGQKRSASSAFPPRPPAQAAAWSGPPRGVAVRRRLEDVRVGRARPLVLHMHRVVPRALVFLGTCPRQHIPRHILVVDVYVAASWPERRTARAAPPRASRGPSGTRPPPSHGLTDLPVPVPALANALRDIGGRAGPSQPGSLEVTVPTVGT